MLLAFRSLTDYILNKIPFVALFLPPHSVTLQRLVCECMGEWCVCVLWKRLSRLFSCPLVRAGIKMVGRLLVPVASREASP